MLREPQQAATVAGAALAVAARGAQRAREGAGRRRAARVHRARPAWDRADGVGVAAKAAPRAILGAVRSGHIQSSSRLG